MPDPNCARLTDQVGFHIPPTAQHTAALMRVAVLATIAASKKEPLVAMMNRVRQAFLDAGLGEPVIHFNFGDAMVPGLAALVKELYRTFVPDIERAAGPSPEWYHPES